MDIKQNSQVLEPLLSRIDGLRRQFAALGHADDEECARLRAKLMTSADELHAVGVAMQQHQDAQSAYDHLEMLHFLDQAVLRGEPLEQIAQIALSYIRQVKPWFRSRVMLFDFDNGIALNLAYHDAAGNPQIAQDKLPLTLFAHLDVLAEGTMLRFDDLQEETSPGPLEKMMIDIGVRAYLGIPLMVEEELMGFLAVSQFAPGPFGAETIEILKTTAAHLAIAILQARLRDRLRHHTSDLEEMVARQTAALRQERDFMAAILDTAGALVVITDAGGHILRFNRACERLSGLRQEQVRGKTFWEIMLIPQAEREKVKGVFSQLNTGRFPHYNENHWQRQNGEKRLLAWSNTVLVNEKGDVEYMVGIAIDITEQRAAEKALQANRAFLDGIISTATDAIIAVDDQQKIILFNEAAGETFGFESADLIGRPLQLLLPPTLYEDHEEQFHQFNALGDRLVSMRKPGEVWGQRADGSIFPLEAVVSTVSVAGQKYYTVIMRDITVRKRDEAEKERLFLEVSKQRELLRQLTQKVVMAAELERDRLSRELHDEAGQSLTALKYSLSALQAELPLRGGAADQLSDIFNLRLKQGIELCETTLQRIRNVAHDLRPTTLHNVGINLTLEGFCRDFAERTGLRIDYAGVETASFDDLTDITLYRCLQESLTNVARHAGAAQVWVALNVSKEETTLSIEDDGCGFDMQLVLNEASGQKGIGLLGIQERLEQLGGRLEVDTQPGGGTLVLVHIPNQPVKGNGDEEN